MVKRSGILFPAIVSSTLTIPIMFSESLGIYIGVNYCE